MAYKYLKTIICKKCKNPGKVKLVVTRKNFKGYICDNCNWYYSIDKKDKMYLNNKELKVK